MTKRMELLIVAALMIVVPILVTCMAMYATTTAPKGAILHGEWRQ